MALTTQPQPQSFNTMSFQGRHSSTTTQANYPRSQSHSIPGPQQGYMLGLDQLIAPGDVVCVKGSAAEGMTRLGATGGFMGHVLLALAPPQAVHRNSAAAITYSNIWPSQSVDTLWLVSTIESCRAHEGFHRTTYVLYVNERGRILALAETKKVPSTMLIRFEVDEEVSIFQSPPALRDYFDDEIKDNVLEAMRHSQGSWSWGTAIKAFLFSADMQRDSAMQEMEQQWLADPICTSVVIVFWQRYLCQFAESCNGMKEYEEDTEAMDWILNYMPLQADRALPGDLLSTLSRCGWKIVQVALAHAAQGRARAASTQW
jgi:hypothetical protein